MAGQKAEIRMARWVGLTAAAALLVGSHAAAQQTDPASKYPSESIRIVVTVSAGGGVDTVTRIVAEKLRQRWGQPVVVENRVGGGGNIAGEEVFNAKPDGYTLLASPPNTVTITALLHKNMTFDPAAFQPVAIMSKFPNVLLVRPDFPAKTAKEFLAYVKANPGRLNYASQGIGSTSHLTAELFMATTGAKLVHIPYKGTAPALNDIVASHVDMIFMELSSAYKLHQANKARILATATDKRLDVLPDVPTMAEIGVADFLSDTWNAITAPPKTPRAIVEKINAAINDAIKTPDVEAHLKSLNVLPAGGSVADAGKFVADETRRWSAVIKKAGIQPQ